MHAHTHTQTSELISAWKSWSFHTLCITLCQGSVVPNFQTSNETWITTQPHAGNFKFNINASSLQQINFIINELSQGHSVNQLFFGLFSIPRIQGLMILHEMVWCIKMHTDNLNYFFFNNLATSWWWIKIRTHGNTDFRMRPVTLSLKGRGLPVNGLSWSASRLVILSYLQHFCCLAETQLNLLLTVLPLQQNADK